MSYLRAITRDIYLIIGMILRVITHDIYVIIGMILRVITLDIYAILDMIRSANVTPQIAAVMIVPLGQPTDNHLGW